MNVHRFIKVPDKRHKPSTTFPVFYSSWLIIKLKLILKIHKYISLKHPETAEPMECALVESRNSKRKLFTIYLHIEVSKDTGSNWININDPNSVIVSLFVSVLDKSPFHSYCPVLIPEAVLAWKMTHPSRRDSLSYNISSNSQLFSNTSIKVYSFAQLNMTPSVALSIGNRLQYLDRNM